MYYGLGVEVKGKEKAPGRVAEGVGSGVEVPGSFLPEPSRPGEAAA